MRSDKVSVKTPDRRREIRLPANMDVTLTVLTDQSSLASTVLNLSGSGLLLRIPKPLACGTPVSVAGNDILLLGEVCRCEEVPAAWRVAILVRHSLRGLLELDRLNRRLMGQEPRAPRALPV